MPCLPNLRKGLTMKTYPGLRMSSSDQVLMTLMALRRPPSISSWDNTWIIADLPAGTKKTCFYPDSRGYPPCLELATSSPAARRNAGEGFNETHICDMSSLLNINSERIDSVSQRIRGEWELHLFRVRYRQLAV